MKHLIAVGACYLDTILSVPYYPKEDEKLRATTLIRRRGGNCPNTLEVLQQLLVSATSTQKISSDSHTSQLPNSQTQLPKLVLSSVLPSRSSPANELVLQAFNGTATDTNSYCIYRTGHDEAASSYIIKSQKTSSRTIVNYNDLPEMIFEEFQQLTDAYLANCTNQQDSPIFTETHPTNAQSTGNQPTTSTYDTFWYHFEGRIPPTILSCIRYLRKHPHFSSFTPDSSLSSDSVRARLVISVEVEKPNRPGLSDLAGMADVVFYSKSWAIATGYGSAGECLTEQAKSLPNAELLVCTWGEQGSAALIPKNFGEEKDGSGLVQRPAFKLPTTVTNTEEKQPDTNENADVVDTIGAGDTFIAGILYSLLCSDSSEWDLGHKLDFANELAGRKILQEGFNGLGSIMARAGRL